MTTIADPTLSTAEARAIAVESYVYLFPLVLMELTRRQGTNAAPGERPGFGPMNAFSHFREYPPAEFRAVVRPNFDTLYSSAWLDLTSEPVIVRVPDTNGRYYLLPMLDMWTDLFAVPGKRTSGTGAGAFAVVPQGWRGELPDGVERIDAPTPHVWIIGRTQTNGPADYEAVHAVQDGFEVQLLSGRTSVDHPLDPAIDMTTPPLEQVLAMPAATFFALGRALMTLHPPHATDWSMLARMAKVGEIDDDVPHEALALIKASVPGLAPVVNGWQTLTDGVGVYGNAYLKRACIALAGLGANPPEDAVYPLNVADADGRPLDGANDYVLHFDAGELPPAGAFWSVTMYDDEGFQVANELDRFAMGDRDDLTYNEDGSLDLYLQHGNPGPEREPNWLPAPRRRLGVTMRLYAPKPEVLERRWTPPAIRKVAG